MEDRQQVNIYIETNIRGPKIRQGAYLYLVETFDDDGKPRTQGGFCIQMAAENPMVLGALIRALRRVPEPAYIRVFTRCGHVLNALRNHWPQQWEKDGWKNAKGRPVRNADMWRELMKVMEPHVIYVSEEDHDYRVWLIYEIERRIKEKSRHAG